MGQLYNVPGQNALCLGFTSNQKSATVFLRNRLLATRFAWIIILSILQEFFRDAAADKISAGWQEIAMLREE